MEKEIYVVWEIYPRAQPNVVFKGTLDQCLTERSRLVADNPKPAYCMRKEGEKP